MFPSLFLLLQRVKFFLTNILYILIPDKSCHLILSTRKAEQRGQCSIHDLTRKKTYTLLIFLMKFQNLNLTQCLEINIDFNY